MRAVFLIRNHRNIYMYESISFSLVHRDVGVHFVFGGSIEVVFWLLGVHFVFVGP